MATIKNSDELKKIAEENKKGKKVRLDEKPSKSGGAKLPPAIKVGMEEAFSADFGSVKVHSDSSSQQLCETAGVRAFTVGKHIYFGQGQYNPGSAKGQQLLAHELTHVVQQGGPKGTK